MTKKHILFGTSNKHKLQEALEIFQGTEIRIEHYPVDLLELQDTSLERIARYSLEQLPQTNQEIFVEDTGLFIESLNGFPGPYASHAFKTLGNNGILNLLEGIENRKAYFESYIAFRNKEGQIKTFQGRCDGSIAKKEQGELWGFDPIFIPTDSILNPDKKTFSQLGNETKNKLSHRSKALLNFKNFFS